MGLFSGHLVHWTSQPVPDSSSTNLLTSLMIYNVFHWKVATSVYIPNSLHTKKYTCLLIPYLTLSHSMTFTSSINFGNSKDFINLQRIPITSLPKITGNSNKLQIILWFLVTRNKALANHRQNIFYNWRESHLFPFLHKLFMNCKW